MLPFPTLAFLCIFCALLIVNAKNFRDEIPHVGTVSDMIYLCNVMYYVEDENDIPTDLKSHFFAKTDVGTEVSIVTKKQSAGKNSISVVFRGSNEPDDWATNLDFWPSRFSEAPDWAPSASSSVRVHGGFNDACFSENLYFNIDASVKRVLNNPEIDLDSTIYITGHSLGGADAQLTAVYMAHKNPRMKICMIGFGSPEVGNRKFRDWANQLSNLSAWRFVHKNDIVPRIAIPGLVHQGHLCQMEDDGMSCYYRQYGGGSFSGAPPDWAFPVSISDHNAVEYLEYIEDRSLKNPNVFYAEDFEQEPDDCLWWQPWNC